MLKVAVTGCAGRMGKEIARVVIAADGMELVGGTEYKGHESIGKDLLAYIGEGHETSGGGPKIAADLKEIVKETDVVIDFTLPESSIEHFNVAADGGKAIVIGTTGFSKEQVEKIHKRKNEVRCVVAPNMSVGVNAAFKLVSEAVKILGRGYDIEIVEMHHRLKKDAPSGTAAKLAEICAEGTKRDLAKVGVYGRHGMVGERKPDEIGIMTLRGGDVVGEHTVIFAGEGERLEITHRCTSRKNFAMGAVRAAAWVVEKQNGIYDMQDVLGLR